MEFHPSSLPRRLLALGALLLLACGAEDVEQLRITTHAMTSCPIDPLVLDEATLTLTPLGDFSAPAADVELAAARRLSAPDETRAFEAVMRAAAGPAYLGYAELTRATWLPILLWPEATPCSLGTEASNVGYPAPGGGQAIGYSPAARSVLVVGGSAPDLPAAAEGALTFDTGTGELAMVEPSGLEEPRAFAAITPFGERLLVSGGENPLRSSDPQGVFSPSNTAEIFDPASRSFAATIELSVERTRHAAVELANGDTLLVGGRGPFNNALAVLEIVSPRTERASLSGLAALVAPRLFPVVLPLDDGRLFVGGGSALDGSPLSFLEWLSGDARRHLDQLAAELPPRHDRAFAALPGGGVLAVGGCEAREPETPQAEAACRAACRAGCPPDRYDAWWIGPDRSERPIALSVDAPRPALFASADGRPLLAAGGAADAPLLRFDPWRAEFAPVPGLSSPAPKAGEAAVALDAQAFVWLSEEPAPALFGLRSGTRNRFTSDGTILPPPGDGGAPPAALAPDRPAPSGATEALYADGGLNLHAAPAVRVFLAGTDYGAFALEIEVDAASSALPRVVLGTLELGDGERPWPASGLRARVVRAGDEVTLEVADRRVSYAVPSGRLRLGLHADPAATRTRVVRLRVER